MPFPTVLEQVRDIPLDHILSFHGLPGKREGSTVRYKNDRFNIVVSEGGLWFDNAASLGGRGAIDLLLHVKYGAHPRSASNRALRDAIGWLATFSPGVGGEPPAQATAKHPVPKPTFSDQAAVHAIRDDARWPMAECYLVQGRHLPGDLVRSLHASGDIYASFSQHHPEQTDVCFIHRNLLGEARGATMRRVGSGIGYAFSIAEKRAAWFTLGNAERASQAVLVEAPIDAISYAALERPEDTVILAMSGSHATRPILDAAHARRWKLAIGFDNDRPGNAGWKHCRENYAQLYPDDPQPSRTLSAGKDWNDDLRTGPRRSPRRRL